MSSQPCAICRGATVRREIVAGEISNYCPACGVYTADSDGHEAERRQRISEQLHGLAYDIIARRRAGRGTPA